MEKKLFHATDFNETVLRAIRHSSNGRFSTDFVEMLATVGIPEPSSFKRKDLIAWLSIRVPPSRGTDLELIGGPLVLNACVGLVTGEPLLASRLSKDLKEALAKCKTDRKERRIQVLEDTDARASSPRNLTSAFSGSRSSLFEQIDDAFSLLEGAAASNNFLLRHYHRFSRLSEQMSIRAKRQNMSVVASVFDPVKPSAKFTAGGANDGGADATRNWASSVRDHGQFGSHPSFDAMDDESGP